VLSFARRRAPDPETAQDVAAETFRVAWRRIDKVPDGADGELPWLYAVARNILANHLRGQRRGGRLTARLGRTAPVGRGLRPGPEGSRHGQDRLAGQERRRTDRCRPGSILPDVPSV
jgi:RNA polymerase sigma-70 factor (ECF subfamily)